MAAVEATQGGMVLCNVGEDITIGTRDLVVCIGLVVVGDKKVGVAQIEDTLNMESIKKAVVGEEGIVEKVFVCKSASKENDVTFMQDQIIRHVQKTFEGVSTTVEVEDCCFVNGKSPHTILKKPPTVEIAVASPERQVCHYWMSIIQGVHEGDDYELLDIDVQYEGMKEIPYIIQFDEVKESIVDGTFKDFALESLEQVFLTEGVEPEIAKEEWDIKLGSEAFAFLKKSLK